LVVSIDVHYREASPCQPCPYAAVATTARAAGIPLQSKKSLSVWGGPPLFFLNPPPFSILKGGFPLGKKF